MKFSQDLFENNLKMNNVWNDDILQISKGYFNITLPISKVQDISFLRLDGDLFISTWDALENLYHKVVPGGYIYVDDYGSFEGCRLAIGISIYLCIYITFYLYNQQTIYLSL
jgi:hypothetical protein